jgi:asparagine N-glycosylation enzyme membrane subunit Stt3
MHIFQPEAFPLADFFLNYKFAPLTFSMIFALASLIPERLEKTRGWRIKPLHLAGFLIVIMVFSIAALKLQDIVLNMVSGLRGQLLGGNLSAVEAQTISSAGYSVQRNPFSFFLFFIPIGAYYYFKDSKNNLGFEQIFVLSWLATGTLAAFFQVRLFFILAPVASMMIAYSFLGLHAAKLKSSESRGANLLVALFLILVMGTLLSEVGFARDLAGVNAEKIGHWENAMEALRKNTPEDSVVFAWWDYGYIIQGLGERATIADPGGGFRRRVDVSKMFTFPEDRALKIIKKYNPDNKPAYVIVSFEEIILNREINELAKDELYIFEETIPKSGSSLEDQQTIKNFIGSNKIESFVIENIGGFWRIWVTGIHPETGPDPEMKNKLLLKLLPFTTGAGQGLLHFKLVYKDESNFILMYEIMT